MMSLYLTSERLAKGSCGSGDAEPPLGQKAARDRAVAEKLHAALLAQRNKAVLGPLVEKRVLDLHRHERHAGVEQGSRVGCIEVGAADLVDLPLVLKLLEDERGLDGARNGVVPPVELHEIEALHPEPPERAVDDLAHIGAVDRGRRASQSGTNFVCTLKFFSASEPRSASMRWRKCPIISSTPV